MTPPSSIVTGPAAKGKDVMVEIRETAHPIRERGRLLMPMQATEIEEQTPCT
jgi:hypothetical protein